MRRDRRRRPACTLGRIELRRCEVVGGRRWRLVNVVASREIFATPDGWSIHHGIISFPPSRIGDGERWLGIRAPVACTHHRDARSVRAARRSHVNCRRQPSIAVHQCPVMHRSRTRRVRFVICARLSHRGIHA